MEDFTRKVENELTGTSKGTNRRTEARNLNKSELEALDEIKNMSDLVVTKADKGGALVLQDVDKYIEEAQRQLSDQTFYKKVESNPTDEHAF